MTRLMTTTAVALFTATAVSAATDIADVDMTADEFVGYEELRLAFPEVSEEDFDAMDLNGDNRICSVELLETDAQNILARYNMVPMEERAQVVLDAYYDRFVTMEEFTAIFPTFSDIDFDTMDDNNDNRVSYVEVYQTEAQDIIARYYGGTVADIAKIDTNGDNFADFNEMMGFFPEITEVNLQLIDTNNDNRISSQELYDPKAQQIVSRY